jgi:hypothetical protein
MSRAKFYRMQKAGTLPAQIRDRETNSSAAGTKYLQLRIGQSHTSEQTALGPARKASPIRSVGADGHSPRTGASRKSFVPLNRFRHRYRRGEVSGTPTSSRRR